MADSNSKAISLPKPQVVVAVFILKDNKFLIGKRIGSIGEGTWCIPGGRLEFGEELLEGAQREVLEETGLKIKNLRLGTVVNDYSIKDKWHYATICYVADYISGTVKIMEPNKCLEWRWVEWKNLPKPLFAPMKLMVDQRFNPFKK
jgi:8-oxo-dGTP diphosphatase